jgi:glucokinase
MSRTVGVLVMEHIAVGLVENHKVVGTLNLFPEKSQSLDPLQSMPTEGIVDCIRQLVEKVTKGEKAAAIGIGFPGIIRNGVVEDSPNLHQAKGFALQAALSSALTAKLAGTQVRLFNDADVMAAGIAATRGKLDKLFRVWTIGNGIGFGRYPYAEGPWEGGHTIITLDPKEKYCACGGRGHLEGITGHRAMRLRFLDLEPDEVFAAARKGDKRCADFVELWHLALAAATATQIHLEGPGRFYFTGRDIDRLEIARLREHLYQMVKMSPLQNYTVEVIPEDPTIALIGAGAAAEQACR